MLDEPPLAKRPTWYAATTVEPHAKLSGSTAVSCWLAGFVEGSTDSLRDDHLAVRRDAVGRVRADDVASAAAVDAVDAAPGRLDEVVPEPRGDRVRGRRPDDRVAPHGPADRRRGHRCGEHERCEGREEATHGPPAYRRVPARRTIGV